MKLSDVKLLFLVLFLFNFLLEEVSNGEFVLATQSKTFSWALSVL